MEITSTVLWLVAAAVLGILELMLSTFYLLVLAIAACASSLSSYLGISIEWQIVVFAIFSVIGSLWVRRVQALKPKNDFSSEALQRLDEGQMVEVLHWKESGQTTVQYRGAQWKAQAYKASQLEKGMHRIVEIRGNTLILEKVSQ